jgi:hypothetical protein
MVENDSHASPFVVHVVIREVPVKEKNMELSVSQNNSD